MATVVNKSPSDLLLPIICIIAFKLAAVPVLQSEYALSERSGYGFVPGNASTEIGKEVDPSGGVRSKSLMSQKATSPANHDARADVIC